MDVKDVDKLCTLCGNLPKKDESIVVVYIHHVLLYFLIHIPLPYYRERNCSSRCNVHRVSDKLAHR